jgi:hypothetical protein
MGGARYRRGRGTRRAAAAEATGAAGNAHSSFGSTFSVKRMKLPWLRGAHIR